MSDLPAPAATAVHALLASLVRHALVAAGSALVTRGIVDQGAVDGFIATMVETIVGTLMVAGATGWAQARAFLSHTRLAAAWAALNGDPQPEADDRLFRLINKIPPASAAGPLPVAAAGQAVSAGPSA
ncbi:Pam3-gp28 family putative phage holin [Sphingomonas nostoxanthinifaciens]|uniref:Pam3-gp28 family putative phage holin n=1 Tax=Sphingomonas nostoxanthinifaciens TaxID=2872652 RepID=UPI001CC1E916|nr:hypothetical protein [Sphingomonas nostoxanthinifaciens]UAK24333.1 hypothetical protein K8P63_18805 [Sphingomonas nostoxanthinifaciens]